MEITLLYLFFGIILLSWASDCFVTNAINLAKFFNISERWIGLTIVSLGTSAPEIFVSGFAASLGKSDLAVANVIGSNIANFAFVLGISALIQPIHVKQTTLKQEFPLLFLIMGLICLCFWDNLFSRQESIFLCVCLIGLFIKLYYQIQSEPNSVQHNIQRKGVTKSYFFFIVGLLGLLFSAKALVTGALRLAEHWGVNHSVIGLTIVALGSSLPMAIALQKMNTN